MRRFLPIWMIAGAVLAVPSWAAAQDAKPKPRPERPNPEAVFKAIDKNGDGQLSLDEFKEGMKRVQARLAQARRPEWGPRPGMGHGGPDFRRPDGPPRYSWREGPPRDSWRNGPPRDWRRHGPPRGWRPDGPPRDSWREGPGRDFRREGPSREEIQERMAAVHKQMAAKMAERFKAADKNQDGKISREEAPERLKERFAKIDANADGQLTPAEIRKAMKTRHEQFMKHGAAPGGPDRAMRGHGKPSGHHEKAMRGHGKPGGPMKAEQKKHPDKDGKANVKKDVKRHAPKKHAPANPTREKPAD